jgi:hypothetical protein
MSRAKHWRSYGGKIYMGDVITGMGFEMALKYLPKWLNRRLYPTTRIAQEIKIDLRSNNPIQIARSDLPYISLSFEITNHSLADLVLDRMLIGILINSQPIIYGAMLERYEIPKRNTTVVYHKELLTSLQEGLLRNRRNPQNKMIETIYVDVTAYFDFNSEIIKKDGSNIYAQKIECEL